MGSLNGVVLDTNILIDHLNDVRQATYLLRTQGDIAISPVTWMEVMVGAKPETEDMLRHFLRRFINLPIDKRVSEIAVVLRRQYRIKLPDAVVWATAQIHNRTLVTRNTKDFPNEPGVHIPYRV